MLNAKHVVTAAKGLVEGSRRSETILWVSHGILCFLYTYIVFTLRVPGGLCNCLSTKMVTDGPYWVL